MRLEELGYFIANATRRSQRSSCKTEGSERLQDWIQTVLALRGDKYEPYVFDCRVTIECLRRQGVEVK